MRPDASTLINHVILLGEWSVAEALERLDQLTGEFGLLLEAEPRAERVAIDMAGVTSLDACGCQLLALFLGNLKRHDVRPELCGTSPEMRVQISLLGFLEALGLASEPEKENS